MLKALDLILILKNFNTTDFVLSYGIGVKIPVSKKVKLSLENKAQGGVSNIFRESNINVLNSHSSFNVGLNFMIK